jgi:chromosome segregation ATPase
LGLCVVDIIGKKNKISLKSLYIEMNVLYEEYLKAYKNALESLKKREQIKQGIQKLQEEKKENLVKLKSLISHVTEYKAQQSRIEKLEERIKVKSALIQKRKTQINQFKEKCQTKRKNI